MCTTCGVVIDEELFKDDEKKDLLPNNSNDYCNLIKHTPLMRRALANQELRTASRKEAKQMLDYCLSYFHFTDVMRQDAKLIFIQLINSQHFYSCSSKTKIILAGVCAYLVMNKFDYVITKNAIAKAIGCTVSRSFFAIFTIHN